MAASKGPKPNLAKSTALAMAQSTVNRLVSIIPTLASVLSPTTVYQPGATYIGNELSAPTAALTAGGYYGVWIAPDLLGTGAEYYVEVECFGAGGGGGGGAAASGGGGGGGGEYACETQYPVKPGTSYAYVVGLPGSGGYNNSTQVNPGAAGTSGGNTVFDIAGLGLANGVVANGGTGGDQTSVGIGGAGGTGSANSIHYNGGLGGTNVSGNGSDNPLTLAQTAGMFAGGTLNKNIISAWYILNDNTTRSAKTNDATLNGQNATNTNFTEGLGTGQPGAPAQVPAYAAASGVYGPNPTFSGTCFHYQRGDGTHAAAETVSPGFTYSGAKLTVSCWVKCDPAGVFGSTTANAAATIAGNSDYTTGGKGFALVWRNIGTVSNPNWQIQWYVSTGSTTQTVTYTLGTPNTSNWIQIVGTFNSGNMVLYVNGVSVSTATASFTSVPGGASVTAIGINYITQAEWYYGYISNIWFANDCATSTLVAQAYGSTPATGGAGGAASGGPGGAGGAGSSGSGVSGGAGGVQSGTPYNLVYTTTASQSGYAGGNAGVSGSISTPVGGPFGAGGGGSGDMPSSPVLQTVTIPFAAAAAYNGTDAASGATTVYNPNQQSNPNSNLNTLLYAGGLATDIPSGSKNSLLLLPAGLSSSLGNGSWTIEQVFLTFTNAYPQNSTESLLELGCSAISSLPQSYNGTTLASTAEISIPTGAGTITFDITASGIGSAIQAGLVTSLTIGPGATPSFDAYNAPAGQQFYCSIYGPGAADQFGNSQAPYLTVIMQNTLSPQQGSPGASGGINITALNNTQTPVATIVPFATTDPNGNQFAQGYTGPVTSFDPTVSTPGSYVPESWKTLSTPSGMSGTFRYKRLAETNFIIVDVRATINSTSTSSQSYTTGTAMLSPYCPVNQYDYSCAINQGVSVSSNAPPRVQILTSGYVKISAFAFTTSGVPCEIQGTFVVPLD